MAGRRPNLFPDLRDCTTGPQMRSYVRHRLTEMAKDGTLFLTDCMNQGRNKAQREVISTLVGDVLFGYDVDPAGNQRTATPVPREIQAFRVRLRSIPCRVQVDVEQDDMSVRVTYVKKRTPISWKDHPNIVSSAMDYDAAYGGEAAFAGDVEYYETNIINTGELETELNPRDAWMCLRQSGKHCKPARSRRLQSFYWKCEELKPGSRDEETKETPKAKRGRPRKNPEADGASPNV